VREWGRVAHSESIPDKKKKKKKQLIIQWLVEQSIWIETAIRPTPFT
jgi:hypothetical protein